MSAPLLPLTVTEAEVVRRGTRLLGPVSFRLDGEGATVLLGPNGAGKSTFLRLLHGLERPGAGRLDWPVPTAEARTRQAYVFQTPTLLRRSVLDNAAYPLRLRGHGTQEARARAAVALDEVGLSGRSGLDARALSGGERQKLALARALVTDPEVLFLDEPTASLDGRATREIEAILQRLRAGGTRLVMATHDLGQARRTATDIVFMLHGRLHEVAPAAAFWNAPSSAEARAFLRGDIVE